MRRNKKIFSTCINLLLLATATVASKNAIKACNAGDNGRNQSVYEKYIKRPQDFLLASCALVTLSPLMGITALCIKWKLGGPVLFTQLRPGLNGKEFKLYKFRTMSNERDKEGNLLPDSERLTKFGRILRSMSIDELPELLNIAKGEMAIVGPRPLASVYLPFYTEEERHRHDVRPGLTGLAQINGRNNLSWEEKISFDVDYVKNITFAEDFMIVAKTIGKVLAREGIGQGEQSPVSLHIERSNWVITETGAVNPNNSMIDEKVMLI